jgi:biopolymer transport protein ExbD
MGMSSAGGSSAKPNINVTPLIDVLLVLLIIFMVITPAKPSRFEAKVPAEPKQEEQNVVLKPNPNALIVFVTGQNLDLKLNQDEIGNVGDTGPLSSRLKTIFDDRENRGVFRPDSNEVEKTVFIKAPKGVPYGEVVKVIDAVKLAGADPVGLQIDDLSDK